MGLIHFEVGRSLNAIEHMQVVGLDIGIIQPVRKLAQCVCMVIYPLEQHRLVVEPDASLIQLLHGLHYFAVNFVGMITVNHHTDG